MLQEPPSKDGWDSLSLYIGFNPLVSLSFVPEEEYLVLQN